MSRHLRLVKAPAAGPYPRRVDGIELRRVGVGRWWLSQSRGGRVVDLWLTNDELDDLLAEGARLRAMDLEDR